MNMKNGKTIIYFILILFMSITTYRICDLSINSHAFYVKEYENLTSKLVSGPSAPRGRILDVNGKVLVDNIGVNAVVYNRTKNSELSETELAYKLGSIIKLDYTKFTTKKFKTFYLKTHNNGNDLITEEEKILRNERKLSKDDIEALKYERVTDDILNAMTEEDKNASAIYYLLTNGYSYEDKFIKTGVTDEEVVLINDLHLPGIKTTLTWERTYPYGDTLKTLLGSISQTVPKELKKYYEEKGISPNSTVGISFLELEYDEYLRGTDSTYKVNDHGLTELVTKETVGHDLYLSIDIDKQIEIENIVKNEMLKAKKAKNTEYYNHSYVLIGNPKTGEIITAVGLQLNTDHFVDITANMISSSYTVGSIVKGATMSVGYEQNLINEGTKVRDSCIKVYGVQQKCSWKSLGLIDDISAMALSSNYYQFLIATKLANSNYSWNAKLNTTKEHFNIYRNMLSSYGLGTKTGIDLPNETTGIIGQTINDDLLLNLSIGQYDTYTPIEVLQYTNTLANNGTKLKPTLMKKIVKDDKIIKEMTPTTIGTVNLNPEKMARVQQGLKAVMTYGLGKSYTTNKVSSAGKTGTSETFIDTNGDGRIDTKTISTSFIMYAPFENPEYSVVIISPNIAKRTGNNNYKYSINLNINRAIMNYLFP